MKNLKQILNNIAFYTQANVSKPCCTAYEFWKKEESLHIKRLEDLYVEYADKTRPSDRKTFKIIYAGIIDDAFQDFIKNYCECQKSMNSVGALSPSGIGPSPGTSGPTPPSQSEYACSSGLNILTNTINPTDLNQLLNTFIIQTTGSLGYRVVQKFLESFMISVGYYIDSARGFADPNVIRTDNIKNFFDDNCRLKSANLDAYTEYMREAWITTAEQAVMRVAEKEWFYITTKTSDIESLTADCAPSTGDESVISLLGALGVGAASVTVVGYLGAIFKGNVKKCADKRQAAKKATTQLLALLGAGVGSFSATQVSEAEIVDRVEDIIIKDCEGRLPYSCGEGGFEGPDDGDESGEVDAPDGGGIGGIG